MLRIRIILILLGKVGAAAAAPAVVPKEDLYIYTYKERIEQPPRVLLLI